MTAQQTDAPAETRETATAPDAPRRRNRLVNPLLRRPKRRSRTVLVLCMGWLGLVILVALTVQWLPLQNYSAVGSGARLLPFADPSHILGTDRLGRDVLARLAHGARVSLVVSVSAVIIGMVVGGLLGTAAGYFGGKIDGAFGLVMDSALAFPPLILLLAVTTVFTPSLPSLAAALAVLAVPAFARLARAGTLPLRNREFVVAARAMGARDLRIILREIVPSIVPALMAYGFIVAATVIVAEGSLSFLGLGIPPPTPSWGGMIADGRSFLADSPLLVFVPATALILTVHSLNVVGDWARQLAESPAAHKGAS
jgi:peptide/nickel transport system permease protein